MMGPLVEVRRDVVGGHAGDADAVLAGLAVGLRARERRQQRRVDVDDTVLVAEHHLRAEDAHVPRQHDEVGFVLVEQLQQVPLVGDALLVADVVELQPVVGRQRFEVVVVADDHLDVGAQFAVSPRLEQRLQTVGLLGQLPTAEAVGLSVDSRSADTYWSDATSVAFTVITPDFRAY